MKLERYHITLIDAGNCHISDGDVHAYSFMSALEVYDEGPGVAEDTIKIEIVRVPS